MANLNKVMLIGRLTRDPAMQTFSNGGKVAKFGFAINNKRKDPQTGQWVDDPCFLEVEAFNRGDFSKTADQVEQDLHLDNQAFIEGHFRLDQWEDENGGGKRSSLKVVADNLQFIEPRSGLNKVMLIGRLTRDPEARMFANGGKVAKFGFAVNNRRKDPQTGQWVEEPVFLDVEAFNRGEFGKTADVVEQYLHKGNQAFIEGHLKLDQWEDKNGGGKRSKLKIVVDNVQFLEPRSGDGGAPRSSSPPMRRPSAPPPGADYDSGSGSSEGPIDPSPPGRGEEDIPF